MGMCAVVTSLPAIHPLKETTMLQVWQGPVKVVDPSTASPTTPTPSFDPTSAAPTDYRTTETPTRRPTAQPSTSDSGQMVYGQGTGIPTTGSPTSLAPTTLVPSATPTTHSPLAPGETHSPTGSHDRSCLCPGGKWIDLVVAEAPYTGSCGGLLDKNQSSCEGVKNAIGGLLKKYPVDVLLLRRQQTGAARTD